MITSSLSKNDVPLASVGMLHASAESGVDGQGGPKALVEILMS